MKKFYLEELCTACYNLNYEEVVKILKDPLSKSIINQSWAGDDKSYAAPPLIVTLISGVESNSHDTIKIVKALIRNGADVNIVIKLPDINLKQPASMSPLMILMWYKTCDIEIVKFLIQNGADMNFKNEYGMNPLYWAICNPNGIERAKFLISAGADIDIQVNEEKIKGAGVLSDIVIGGVAVTPLQLASKLGKIEIVKELLLNGANTKIKNGYGHDALQLAKQNENDEIFKILSQRNSTWEKETNVSLESNEDLKSPSRKSNPNNLITLIEKNSKQEIKIEENANNDSFLEMVVTKDESFESNNEELQNKDYYQLKDILPQLKKQSQKKDDIILNLRQQIKQLNKTLQEKDKIIQKNNDTVSLVFHIFNDNLKSKEIN